MCQENSQEIPVDQRADADDLLGYLEGKVTFDKRGVPTYQIVDEAKYQLSLKLSSALTKFVTWNPKKESAAHAAAQVGLSKSTFLEWARKFTPDEDGQKGGDQYVNDLADLRAQSHGLPTVVWALTCTVQQVCAGAFLLDELKPVEQEFVRKVVARYGIEPLKVRKATIFDQCFYERVVKKGCQHEPSKQR